MTTVVNLKGKRDVPNACDVYIGRANFMGGWRLHASKWANPFKVKDCGSNEKAIELYEDWIRQQPHLMDSLNELEGKRLGCWCKPAPCHGDILKKLIDEQLHASSSSSQTIKSQKTRGFC